MIHLKPLNLYAIEVPIEAHSFECDNPNLYYDFNSDAIEKYIGFDFEILGWCTNDDISFKHPTLSDSELRKAITDNGLHFVNTMPKPVYCCCWEGNCGVGCDFEKWQSAENELIKKLLIIQPK